MKSKALCYFQHKGIDYKKGVTIELPEKDTLALEKIGLVGEVTATVAKASEPETQIETGEQKKRTVKK